MAHGIEGGPPHFGPQPLTTTTFSTLAHAIELDGVGLFSGVEGRVRLVPKPTFGIEFRMGGRVVPASVAHVVLSPMRNSVLAADAGNPSSPRVATIEHMMSALVGMGVWGATVEVEGPEVPIFDGSARAMVEAIAAAGRTPLTSQAEPILITEPLRVQDAQGASILIEPRTDGRQAMSLVYRLDYGPAAAIAPSAATWDVDFSDAAAVSAAADHYAANISPARTFSLESEAKAFAAMGLFKHLTTRDMVVIAEHDTPTTRRGEGVENPLRFADEPVRHKLLDLVGDLALLGRPFVGVCVAEKSGHALAHALCRDAARLFS